ncbi:hypothetical protein D3C76_1020070 [compost metagenome]
MGNIQNQPQPAAFLHQLFAFQGKTAVPRLQHPIRRPVGIIPGQPQHPDSHGKSSAQIDQTSLQPVRPFKCQNGSQLPVRFGCREIPFGTDMPDPLMTGDPAMKGIETLQQLDKGYMRPVGYKHRKTLHSYSRLVQARKGNIRIDTVLLEAQFGMQIHFVQ